MNVQPLRKIPYPSRLKINVITAAQDDIIEMLHSHKIQLSLVYGGLYNERAAAEKDPLSITAKNIAICSLENCMFTPDVSVKLILADFSYHS